MASLAAIITANTGVSADQLGSIEKDRPEYLRRAASLFMRIDANSDGVLNRSELNALVGEKKAEFMMGVEIVDVIIQDVSLPEDICVQMSNKTMTISLQAYEQQQQQYDIQAIQLRNALDMQKLNQGEAMEKTRAEMNKSNQVYKDQYAEAQVIRMREYNDFVQQTNVEKEKIQADKKEIVLRLRLQKEEELQKLALEAEEAATRVQAEGAAKIQELQAETKFKIAQMDGESIKALAAAEEKSDQHLVK